MSMGKVQVGRQSSRVVEGALGKAMGRLERQARPGHVGRARGGQLQCWRVGRTEGGRQKVGATLGIDEGPISFNNLNSK